MKVLLDECLPRRLKELFPEHEVKTVQDAGWAGRKNGELLALAESSFDVFMTSDQNIVFQQKLAGRSLSVIQLPTNTLSAVKAYIPAISKALMTIRPGDLVQIRIPLI